MGRLPAEVFTPRCHLRLWTAEDLPALRDAVTQSLEHLRPWMWWAQLEPLTMEQRRDVVEGFAKDWERGSDTVYAVFDAADGSVAGGCGLHRRRGPGVLEIGYWIHVQRVRQGLATEVARSLTDTAFGEPDIERVEIHHDRANVASRGVPEGLGFRFLGECPDEARAPAEEGVDCTWSVDRAPWEAARRRQ